MEVLADVPFSEVKLSQENELLLKGPGVMEAIGIRVDKTAKTFEDGY